MSGSQTLFSSTRPRTQWEQQPRPQRNRRFTARQIGERKVRDRSLLSDHSSLLLRINSLFCFLGNFPATHCSEYRAHFYTRVPVLFPVRSETAARRLVSQDCVH